MSANPWGALAMWWAVRRLYDAAGPPECDREQSVKDRYLNVDDPRDPPAEAQAPPGGATGTAGPLGRDPPQEGPAEPEVDRCVRVVREVLLGQPVPHSLEAAYLEVERRLKGGAG